MKRFIFFVVIVLGLICGVSIQTGIAACSHSHQECTYECTEYYPNGTDCRKTVKHCNDVCDDYDVHTTGEGHGGVPTSGGYPPSDLQRDKENSDKK